MDRDETLEDHKELIAVLIIAHHIMWRLEKFILKARANELHLLLFEILILKELHSVELEGQQLKLFFRTLVWLLHEYRNEVTRALAHSVEQLCVNFVTK